MDAGIFEISEFEPHEEIVTKDLPKRVEQLPDVAIEEDLTDPFDLLNKMHELEVELARQKAKDKIEKAKEKIEKAKALELKRKLLQDEKALMQEEKLQLEKEKKEQKEMSMAKVNELCYEFNKEINKKYIPVVINELLYAKPDGKNELKFVEESSCASHIEIVAPFGVKPSIAFANWRFAQKKRICEGYVFKPFRLKDCMMSFTYKDETIFIHEEDSGFHIYNELLEEKSTDTLVGFQNFVKTQGKRKHLMSIEGIVDVIESKAETKIKMIRNLNSFTGFMKPSIEGDCPLILKLIKEGICRGNEEAYNWFLSYFAHILQTPAVRVPLIPVLQGEQGCGKGTVMDYIKDACIDDKYYSAPRAKDLSGGFNGALENKMLIFADEAAFSGDYKVINELKRITGDKYVNIERKGIDPYGVENYTRVVIATNNGWAAPIEAGNRRYVLFPCIYVYGKSEKDKEMFLNIHDEKYAGGLAALNYYLKNYDISTFDPFTCPMFFAEQTLDIQFMTSMKTDPVEAYFIDCEAKNIEDYNNILESATFLNNEMPTQKGYEEFFLCWFNQNNPDMKFETPSLRTFVQTICKHGYESKVKWITTDAEKNHPVSGKTYQDGAKAQRRCFIKKFTL